MHMLKLIGLKMRVIRLDLDTMDLMELVLKKLVNNNARCLLIKFKLGKNLWKELILNNED
jgi:hypothetical protein